MSTFIKRGLFIVFEGTEGVGKTTQSKLLAEWFERLGVIAMRTREPGGTVLSVSIRNIVLHATEKIPGKAELLLFLADRAAHVNELLIPALECSNIVLCDRYEASGFAYQCAGKGMSKEAYLSINAFAREEVTPDLTIWLDMDPLAGLARAGLRGQELDRFESEETAFHQRVREGFREFFSEYTPTQSVRIDASQSPALVHQEVIGAVRAILSNDPRFIPVHSLP